MIMKPSVDATITEHKAYCAALEQRNAELSAKVHWLEEKFRLAMKQRFGSSSERSHPDQLSLIFDEAEVIASPSEPEPTLENITYQRRKKRGHREEVLQEL